jgi:hypothetical protein
VYLAVLSKYEAGLLKRKLAKLDPFAFIVYSDDVDLSGHYQTRIDNTRGS